MKTKSKKTQQTSSAVFFFSQKGIATNQTSRRRILSSFQPARTPELWEEWFIPTGAQRRHLVAGGRWQVGGCGVNFFPWIKRKTGKLKHLEMIDWDWDWIWDWDRLESVSNYLPRPELLPRWLWVACLDFHDIQGINFPEFVSNRIHIVSVHIIFFAKLKLSFPKSSQNSGNKLPWTFLHHTPLFAPPQFRCFSPLGSW